MTVALSSSGRIQPGRFDDFVAQANEVTKIYERLGTAPPRMHLGALAGEAFWTWSYTVEFEDWDAFGEISDQWSADAEAQAFMLRLAEPSNPAPLERTQLAVQVPSHDSVGGRGSQMALYVSRIHPGQQERTFELGARACAFAERHGALNCRIWNMIASGSATGLALSTMEFEGSRSWARVMSAFTTEAEGRAIAAAGNAADAPSTIVFEGVYTEVPL